MCFVVGLRAHSLALLSEAGHNVSDAAALLLSFVAVWLGGRPANDAKTFGYQRAGVLAAFFNALTLVAISTWIAIEAVARLRHPEAVASTPMMFVAAAGVVMNGLIATMLWQAGTRSGGSDVNLRSVFIHMLGDTLSTAAVILGGLVIRPHRLLLGRPRALARHCRAYSLVVHFDRTRNPQHPARRDAGRYRAAGDPRRSHRH